MVHAIELTGRHRTALYTRAQSMAVSDLLTALRSGASVIGAELRPPRAALEGRAGMDAWIDHEINGCTFLQKRPLAGVQHPKNSQPLFAIRYRPIPSDDALQEMAAFLLQRLNLIERNRLTLGLNRRGYPVLPLDSMWI